MIAYAATYDNSRITYQLVGKPKISSKIALIQHCSSVIMMDLHSVRHQVTNMETYFFLLKVLDNHNIQLLVTCVKHAYQRHILTAIHIPQDHNSQDAFWLTSLIRATHHAKPLT